MKIRQLALLASASLVIAACGTAPSAPRAVAGSGMAAASAEDLDAVDKRDIASIAEFIAATEMSEGGAPLMGIEGMPEKPELGPKGGLLYKMLNASLILRKVGYFVSEGPVRRHFAKPGVPDAVPPLSDAEKADLIALLQPGDIIQCGNDNSFVHAIFYVGGEKHEIVHALAQSGFGKKMIGVRGESLDEYLARVARDKVVVLRPTWPAGKLAEATEYARKQVGKDYDPLFMTDQDDRHYCTELIFTILRKMGAARIEPHLSGGAAHWRLVTNEDIRKSPDLTVVYRRNHD